MDKMDPPDKVTLIKPPLAAVLQRPTMKGPQAMTKMDPSDKQNYTYFTTLAAVFRRPTMEGLQAMAKMDPSDKQNKTYSQPLLLYSKGLPWKACRPWPRW